MTLYTVRLSSPIFLCLQPLKKEGADGLGAVAQCPFMAGDPLDTALCHHRLIIDRLVRRADL